METKKYSQSPGPNEYTRFNKEMILPDILRNWYWFILIAALGFVLAMGFNKYFQGTYKSTMTLLLNNNPHQSPMNSTLNNLEIKEKTINIQDEQSIVSAYSLQLKTLLTLDWKTSIFKKLIIGKKDLYKIEPFRVTLPDGAIEGTNIPLTIQLLSGGNYNVICDYHYRDAEMTQTIKFNAKGSFGKPFDNTWFHFTLETASPGQTPEQGADYILIINDLPQLAIDYQTQLAVKISAPESNVLTVELKGTNVQRNVDYLNALGETYRKFGLDQKNLSAINTLQFIRSQLSGVADSLQVSGNRLTNFRTSNKVVDLSQEGSMILQKAEDVDKQENALKLKINYYSELKRHLNSGEELKNFVAPSIIDPDPDLTNLVQKLTQQFNLREVLSQTAQSRNPKLISVNNDIELTKQLINKTIDGLLTNTQYELTNVRQQKMQTNSRLTSIPKTERQLLDIKRGFDINSQLYNFLLQKRAEAGIALASNSPDAQILDAATPMTTERTGLKPTVNLVIGLLLGTLLAFGIILLRQFTDKRLRDPDAVQRSLNLSVAGMITHNKTETELPVTKYPNSEITESFRNLRTNLRILLKDHPNAVIAVHSVNQAEGKSFISVNISAILSLSGKKVLLLELDKRSSHLEELTGSSPVKDLSEYLKGKASFTEILSSTKVEGLSFIKAGDPDTRLSEQLESGHMEKFIAEARASFDFIIMDNPPMGILSDAKISASYADVNLFVLRIGLSTNKELIQINQTAEDETIRNMIVVLNDISVRSGPIKKAGYFNES